MKNATVWLLALALIATPALARAQQADVVALGGATTYVNQPHGHAGGMLHLRAGGWGVLGIGMVGTGAEYESWLYGGALSRHIASIGAISVSAFAGYGLYGETGLTEIERDAGGPLLGGMASYDAGPFVLTLVGSDLIGSYDGSDVSESFTFHVPRVSVGVGFGIGGR